MVVSLTIIFMQVIVMIITPNDAIVSVIYGEDK